METLLPPKATIITVDDALVLVSGTPFSARLWLLTGMTQFADALELLLLSFLASEIKCPFHLSTYSITLLQTCVLIGMWLGSNVSGVLSDKVGRKPTLILSLACTVAGGVSATFAMDFSTILICRFMVGLGVGSAPVAITLFTDFLPSKFEQETRGRTLVGFFVFFSIGAVFEALVAWATLSTVWRWRALLFVSVLPSVFLLVAIPFFIPESPRWLVSQGQTDRALKVLEYVSRINHGSRKNPLFGVASLIEKRDEGDEGSAAGAAGATQLERVEEDRRSNQPTPQTTTPPTTQTTITLSVLFFLMASLYYSIVLVGSTIVDNHANSTMANNTCNSSKPVHTTGEYVSLVVTNGAELPGLFVAYLLLDRIGRQKSIQVFFGACGVCCLALLVSTSFSQPSPLWLRTLIVFGARAAALGFNQSLWIYTALFYPTKQRNRGLGFTTSFARVGSLLAPVIVNVGGSSSGGLSVVAGLCVCLSLVSFVVTRMCLPKDR